MSNHFTGLSLGPPLGDQRLDLCDLYAFQSPNDASRTVIILNADPNADALHPDAIYRLNIDNNGDLLTDVALSYVFSKPRNGKQTFNVFLAKGAESRSVEAIGKKIVADEEASFGPKPNLVKAGDYTFFAGSRSDAFFFDFDGIKNLFDIRGKRNCHAPVVPVRLPCGGRRRRLSLGTRLLGLLTACWVSAEPDDCMRLNNWSIAASYDTARIFADFHLRLLPPHSLARSALPRERVRSVAPSRSGGMSAFVPLLGRASSDSADL
jgi:hypothetical protein